MSVIGFDFGYQTCYIAVARQGGIETVANEFSDRCTPSVVSLGEKQRVMGGAAKQQMVSNVKNTMWGWKKVIGKPFKDPQVQKDKSLFPYELVEAPGGTVGIKVRYLGEEQVFTPQQVTAMMFTKLKLTAEVALGTKVVDVVISVPCYYTDVERRAMLDSAAMCGLNVLRLMNDTTATALAYGIYKQDLPSPEEKPRVTVFCDMGHNDLQLAAVAFNKGKLKVLATTADPNLGGRDFDLVLAEYFTEDFKKRFKVDAKTKPKAFVRLLTECEKQKKLMSANATDIPINIECFINDKDVSGKMNRAGLEDLASSLLDRAKKTMLSLIQVANLKMDDIYAVELVGGMTRVPAIKNLVKEVFGQEGSTTLNSDESVARGCALQCAILSPTFRVRDFSIVDAQPYPITLCWQGAMEEDDSSSMEVFGVNHQVPFSKMLTFYRRESFSVEARYTDPNIPEASSLIGNFTIDNVVPQATGESSKVKVKVRININGIFYVSSASMVEKMENAEDDSMEVENGPKENGEKENKTEEGKQGVKKEAGGEAKREESPMETDQTEEGKNDKKDKSSEKDKKEDKKKKKVKVIDLPISSKVFQLSKTEVNNLMEKEGQMIMQDKLEKERGDAKNNVEEYVYEMRDKLCNELEPFIKENDRDKFTSLLEATENWLYDEGEDQNKQVYIDKMAELKKFGQPITDRYREAQERPRAFDDFGAALQLVRKALDLYSAKDDKYSHIDAKDMEKVAKCLKEKSNWFDKQLNACTSQNQYDNPAVLVSQIRHERDSLNLTCTPILSKPKPKPKEEPPKEEKKEEKSQPQTEGEAKPSNDQPANAEASTETPAENPPDKTDMDLD